MAELVLAMQPGAPVTATRRAGILLLPPGSARASARSVVLIAAALSVFGLVMLTTVSNGPETPANDPYRFVRRQAVSLVGAAILGGVLSRIDYRTLAKRSSWILGALWALLVVTLLMPRQLG